MKPRVWKTGLVKATVSPYAAVLGGCCLRCRIVWLTPSLLWAAPHAVSPFQQLVAALDCDEIVGKDFSTDSMDMQELRMFVESPMLMRACVKARFRLRENGAMLDDTFVKKLSTKASAALKKTSAHAEAAVATTLHSQLVVVPRGRMYALVGPVTFIEIMAHAFAGGF